MKGNIFLEQSGLAVLARAASREGRCFRRSPDNKQN